MSFRFQWMAVSLLSLLSWHNARAVGPQDYAQGLLTNCSEYYSKFRGRYVGFCHDRSRPDLPQKSNEPVVYFMHGALMNSQQWFFKGYGEDLRNLRKQEDLPPFTVLSFDTSLLDFYSDKGDVHTGKKAYETWFLEEFLPWAEKKYSVCAKRDCRVLIGSSMGGFGALKTALRHPDMFAAAGANAAALLPVNIWAWSMDQWVNYFADKPIGKDVGKKFIVEMREIFPTAELYDQHDPALIGPALVGDARRPDLYFDVTGHDQFGFEDGFARTHEALEHAGYAHQTFFDPDGTHLDSDNTRPVLLKFVAEAVRKMR